MAKARPRSVAGHGAHLIRDFLRSRGYHELRDYVCAA
jgi:hypothetical protein